MDVSCRKSVFEWTATFSKIGFSELKLKFSSPFPYFERESISLSPSI